MDLFCTVVNMKDWCDLHPIRTCCEAQAKLAVTKIQLSCLFFRISILQFVAVCLIYMLNEPHFTLFLFEDFRLPAEHISDESVEDITAALVIVYLEGTPIVTLTSFLLSSAPPLSLSDIPFFPHSPPTAVQHYLASCWVECLSVDSAAEESPLSSIMSAQQLHHHHFPLVTPSPPLFLYTSIPSKLFCRTQNSFLLSYLSIKLSITVHHLQYSTSLKLSETQIGCCHFFFFFYSSSIPPSISSVISHLCPNTDKCLWKRAFIIWAPTVPLPSP